MSKGAMEKTYTPVPYVYREVIEEQIAKNAQGKVFHYDDDNNIACTEGRVVKLQEFGEGLFITMDHETLIRIDRIITLFGKPGAAYDYYDSFGNACLDCKGGYDFDS